MFSLIRLRLSVHTKLLLLALLPLLGVLPVLLTFLIAWGGEAYDRLLIFKIRSDLAVAESYFERVKEGVGRGVEMQAASSRLAHALADEHLRELSIFLQVAKQNLRVDFLHFVDSQGRVLASSDLLPAGTELNGQMVVRNVLESRRAITLLDIFDAETLGAIHPDLRARARIPLVATRNAAPSERNEETRGMLIHASAPVFDEQGHFRGALVGGLLLNRNLDFVDHINEIIYPDDSLPLGSHGTATLFLDDVRIATNVRLFQNERAIGTRVSASVRHSVLKLGETWLDRAFVVNDWYVSGYQPLNDGAGMRIGMLYVGYLDAPFLAIKRWTVGVVVAVFVLAMLIAAVLSLHWARSIFRPLERMNETMSAIEAGDESARVGCIASHDEIGRLAAHFDQLLDRQQVQNLELQRWGNALDAKVSERTRELEESNLRLRDAQRQLVMSEKLAAVGELTAGVAHEINNPVAVIQGNLDVLREVLGPAVDPVRKEMRLMDVQVERIRLIVAKLLQFARPNEFDSYVETLLPREVLSDCLMLVGHLLKRGKIAVSQEITSKRTIAFNRNELQQVIINLLVNAIQAMPLGGMLKITVRDWDDAGLPIGVLLSVTDSGAGILPEHLNRVFDPFFTTKGQNGTGLGLSVSYGLVERYGGHIDVESSPGQGARFTIRMLSDVNARYREE